MKSQEIVDDFISIGFVETHKCHLQINTSSVDLGYTN